MTHISRRHHLAAEKFGGKSPNTGPNSWRGKQGFRLNLKQLQIGLSLGNATRQVAEEVYRTMVITFPMIVTIAPGG